MNLETTVRRQEDLNYRLNDFTIQLVHFVSSRDRHTGKCPHCNAKQSNYERLAEECLIENNVEYIPQKRFEDCGTAQRN